MKSEQNPWLVKKATSQPGAKVLFLALFMSFCFITLYCRLMSFLLLKRKTLCGRGSSLFQVPRTGFCTGNEGSDASPSCLPLEETGGVQSPCLQISFLRGDWHGMDKEGARWTESRSSLQTFPLELSEMGKASLQPGVSLSSLVISSWQTPGNLFSTQEETGMSSLACLPYQGPELLWTPADALENLSLNPLFYRKWGAEVSSLLAQWPWHHSKLRAWESRTWDNQVWWSGAGASQPDSPGQTQLGHILTMW